MSENIINLLELIILKFKLIKRGFGIKYFSIIGILLISIGISFEASAQEEIFNYKSIKCDVPNGSVSVVGRGQSAWKAKEVKEASSYTFDNINYENHKARFIGANTAGDVEVYKSAIGITIILKSEPALETYVSGGHITIFVITPVNLEGKGFPLVESRVMYSAVPSLFAADRTLGSQYFGYCKILR